MPKKKKGGNNSRLYFFDLRLTKIFYIKLNSYFKKITMDQWTIITVTIIPAVVLVEFKSIIIIIHTDIKIIVTITIIPERHTLTVRQTFHSAKFKLELYLFIL